MATETRVFESVDNSPEAKAANAAYFAEQGITHEVTDDAAGAAADPPAGTEAPPAQAAPPADAEEGQVDTETAADWDSAQTDGKRKSRYAKKRQEARDLKAKTEAQDRELAELRAKLAAKDAPPSDDKAAPGTPPAAATASAAFAEPEPVEPKYEDFANEDDQLLAYNKALAKHTREWSRWDRRRENFETQAAADQTRRTDEANKNRETRLTQLNQRLTEVRTELPDFDEVLKQGTVLSPALSAASTVVPGGLKAAYQLAKDPVKLKQFNELTAETQKVNGQDVPTQGAYDLALYLLGQAAGTNPAPASAPAAPAAAIPSSSSQPREERPALPPARGRSTDEPRREDLSGDARRDMLARDLNR